VNLLDENFPADQKVLLRAWNIPVRKIGSQLAHLGVKDPEIIPLLHQLRRVTFFTQDKGFASRALCHPAYCLVYLEVRPDDTALFVRRFLRQPLFDTVAKRMGSVVRVHHQAIQFCQRNRPGWRRISWST
jgi:hypothetical protein